jgi:DNA replication protein DnaC
MKYVRLPDLLNDLAVAHSTGTYQKLMKQYKRAALLILDEWLLLPLKVAEVRDVLEIVEARHQRGELRFATCNESCLVITLLLSYGQIGWKFYRTRVVK